METTSYFQFPASFLTLATILRGVKSLPDANFRGSASPVARIFTLVPPISTARTLGAAFISIPPPPYHKVLSGFPVRVFLAARAEPNRVPQSSCPASSRGWGLGTVKRYGATPTIRDGLFILVSLLLGCTLTMAVSRVVERRSLLVAEAVSNGTTYLRCRLPQPYRDHSRQLLRDYADPRSERGNLGAAPSRYNDTLHRAKHLQESLWLDAATVAQNDRSAVTAVYFNSLNETIDLHEKRVSALRTISRNLSGS